MIGAVIVRPLQCVEVEVVLEGATAPCLPPPSAVTSQWWSCWGNSQPVEEQIIFNCDTRY